MVVSLLANAGEILKGELTYEMLYSMFEKIDRDLHGSLQNEKTELVKLFNICEGKGVSAEKAIINHTERITSYTNTALFQSAQASR